MTVWYEEVHRSVCQHLVNIYYLIISTIFCCLSLGRWKLVGLWRIGCLFHEVPYGTYGTRMNTQYDVHISIGTGLADLPVDDSRISPEMPLHSRPQQDLKHGHCAWPILRHFDLSSALRCSLEQRRDCPDKHDSSPVSDPHSCGDGVLEEYENPGNGLVSNKATGAEGSGSCSARNAFLMHFLG